MKDFLQYLITEIVDNKDKVSIEETKSDSHITYIIDVDSEDMGAVIGKHGRMIRSIRNLCKAKAIKDDIHISIDLKDDNRVLQPIEVVDEKDSKVEETKTEKPTKEVAKKSKKKEEKVADKKEVIETPKDEDSDEGLSTQEILDKIEAENA